MEQLIEWQQRFHWNFDIHLLTVRDFLGKEAAERLLEDLVLYRIPASRLDMLRAIGYRPGTLSVTPAGVEITIEPLPAEAAASAPR